MGWEDIRRGVGRPVGPWGERGRDSDPTEKEWDGSERRRKKERRLKSTDMTFIHFSSVVVMYVSNDDHCHRDELL